MLRLSAPCATLPPTGATMSHVTYQIVRHDEGWAYTVNGVFSEPFPTHDAALAAARTAAAEQRVPGHTETIEYEDEKGHWHTETAAGTRCVSLLGFSPRRAPRMPARRRKPQAQRRTSSSS